MAHHLSVSGVTLDYNIYSVRAQSLRNAAFNLAVGGKLFRGGGDVTVIRALHNIHFELQEGDRLALLGHNGSGKTTLLKVLAGIYEPTHGQVSWDGKVSSSISIGSGLDWDASGLQNIEKLGLMQLVPKRVIAERTPEIIEFSGLGDFVRLPVKTYSAGMMARLMFAVTTAFDADILILDEWLGAGDAAFHEKARERMRGFVERAKILVLATHSEQLAREACNKVCLLEAGHIKFYGPTEEYFAQRNAA